MNQVVLKGPWRGMDCRENDAAENTYPIGMNIDTSNANLEARRPFGSTGATVPKRARLHHCSFPGSPSALLVVGPSELTNTSDIKLRVLDPVSYSALSSTINLTSSFGERPVGVDFVCTFIDTFLAPIGGVGNRPVTLIVTPTQTYVFEPSINLTTVRLAAPAIDAIRFNSANFPYWSTVPFGGIAATFQTRTYYAGFKYGDSVRITSSLPQLQNDVPEVYLKGDRQTFDMAPHMVAFSDEHDPFGVMGKSFIWATPGERVTGLHATSEALLVFTDRAIHATSDGFSLRKLFDCDGCVSHASIVTVAGVTYYAGKRGIYAFGGLGSPEAVKLTECISPYWNGWTGFQTFLPDGFIGTTRLSAFGWPWTFSPSDFDAIVGRHMPSQNQIWWSMPCNSTSVFTQHCMPLTLVYDLEHRAWHVWFQSTRSGAAAVSCFCDGVEVDGTILTTDGNGRLQQYGLGPSDGVFPAATPDRRQGVPVYWLSGRIDGDDANFTLMYDVWVKMLSTGYIQTSQSGGGGGPTAIGSGSVPIDIPYFILSAEGEAWDMQDDIAATQTYGARKTVTARLKCHPNEGGDYFWGTGLWGTFPWTGIDWFTSRVEGQLTARTFRVGFVDHGYNSPLRAPMVTVASISVGLKPTGTPHR